MSTARKSKLDTLTAAFPTGCQVRFPGRYCLIEATVTGLDTQGRLLVSDPGVRLVSPVRPVDPVVVTTRRIYGNDWEDVPGNNENLERVLLEESK